LKTVITIKKFKKNEDKPYETRIVKGNVALNEGLNALWTLVCGGSETAYNNANARIGVGDSETPEDATQTGLLGTNQAYKGMDDGYPTFGSEQKAVFKSTFDDGEAEFEWWEFTVDNGSAPNKNLFRKKTFQGTKVPGEIWIVKIEIVAS